MVTHPGPGVTYLRKGLGLDLPQELDPVVSSGLGFLLQQYALEPLEESAQAHSLNLVLVTNIDLDTEPGAVAGAEDGAVPEFEVVVEKLMTLVSVGQGGFEKGNP